MTEPLDPSAELQRQFSVEFGARPEVIIRCLGTIGAGGLIYGYTGWWAALLWPVGFVSILSTYFLFLRARMDRATPRDETIAGCIFLCVLVSFLWMPAMMVTEGDRVLSLCGAALIGCILVFLVRRSDSSPIMVYGEISVVTLLISIAFARLTPQFSDPLARIGLLASGGALLYYFIEAARVSRKLRLDAAETNHRLLQTEKMAAIGRLAGGVAHDFNNNLTAILGHLELLELVDDPAERRIFINDAHFAARQASLTVKQLLAFARKDQLMLELQDAAETLEALSALTRRLIPAFITMEVRLAPGHQKFMADRGQLMSALINLVVNAVDAMPKGGTLTLSNETHKIVTPLRLEDGTSLDPGRYVRISIEDTGDGIPPDILGQVIEPFFTTKPVGKGTGLGLSMAFSVSKEFGGGLTIASSPQGTIVSVLLPRA